MTLNRGVVIGAFSVAALLPTLVAVWALSNTEAGWISGIYYAAYTLVVPFLSSLTDRMDPKRVYLGSVALTAIAFAGFAWVATGFWSALAFRALMGAGERPRTWRSCRELGTFNCDLRVEHGTGTEFERAFAGEPVKA
jgi:MFS family permease